MRTLHLCGPALLLTVCFSSCAPSAPVAEAPGAATLSPAAIATRAPCPVQGAWALEAMNWDGEARPMGEWRQIKVITASHYAWAGQQPGPAALRSAADSLVAYRTRSFGGGTYQVTDSTYTERLEYFYHPEYVGREITFSCRVEGDRWYHAGDIPDIEAGREVGRVRLEEVWRRLEPARTSSREE